MMTILDIVDTAVKIGLGALISGVTTYFVTTKNNAHEKNHDLMVYKRNKLVEISEKVQSAGELGNRLVDSAGKKRQTASNPSELDLSDEARLAKDSFDNLASAVSISYLINDTELAKLLTQYSKVRSSLYTWLVTNKDSTWNKYDAYCRESIEIRLSIYEQYSKSLEKIYA